MVNRKWEKMAGKNYQKILIRGKNRTEERNKKFICESFKIDENKIFNKDEKLKEEVMFRDNFLALLLHSNHYGKTDLVE